MSMDILRIQPPRFHVAHQPTKDFHSHGHEWAHLHPHTALRFLQGDKMRTYESLFNEFSSALKFPNYFGRNWPAFGECISDLEWLQGATAYLLMFSNAEAIYCDEKLPEYPTLLKILAKAGDRWGKPINKQGPLNRPARPFHCVFQCNGSHSIEEHLRHSSIDFDEI